MTVAHGKRHEVLKYTSYTYETNWRTMNL